MTLDEARDLFECNPNPSSAKWYAEEAGRYHDDGIISDETYDAIMAECRPFLA